MQKLRDRGDLGVLEGQKENESGWRTVKKNESGQR